MLKIIVLPSIREHSNNLKSSKKEIAMGIFAIAPHFNMRTDGKTELRTRFPTSLIRLKSFLNTLAF